MASPKHPQSCTGFLIAKYSVRGVNTIIKPNASHAAILDLSLKISITPTVNSNAERINAKGSDIPASAGISKA